MSEFLRKLDSQHESKRILIVSHGDPLWLLETFTLGLGPEETIVARDKFSPSQGELKKVDFKNWSYDDDGELDLHRPYIDYIELKCEKCGGKMTKVPDLIDVWFDSGAMPYAQWHWPFDTAQGRPFEKTFKAQFPADFIVEAIDQTRGWFYTLLAISTLLGKGAPYKNVMVLGHTLDEKGQKMSKSKGNFVPVIELMDKYGADVLRWYFLSSMTVGESKSMIPKEIEDKLKGFMTTLDNCVRFWELYADKNPKSEILNPKQIRNSKSENVSNFKNSNLNIVSNLLDRWILSKLNGLVGEVSDSLDKYDPTSAAKAIEEFVIKDLSNWWLRRSRKRKAASPLAGEPRPGLGWEVLGLLRFVLLELDKIIAPFVPFVAEDIHKRLHKGHSMGTESVHLHDWPKVNKKLIDGNLENQMDEIRDIVAEGLAIRKSGQLKVRQPLRAVKFGRSNEFLADLEGLIKEELNVKNIVYDASQKEPISLDLELDEALKKEGVANEYIRQIQDMRKEIKLKVGMHESAEYESDSNVVIRAIEDNKILIENITSTISTRVAGISPAQTKIIKEFEIVTGHKIKIGLKK